MTIADGEAPNEALVTSVAPAGAEIVNDDAALGAVWDRIESEKDPADGGLSGQRDGSSPEGEGTGGAKAEVPSPSVGAVPLPANWRGMESEWGKIPAEVQARIAQRDAELHTRMSEQGRQIGALRQYNEIFERNADLLAGRTMPDGSAPSMSDAVDFLFSAQRRLDENPIASLIDIADRYGVRQHLAAALSGQIDIPADPQPPAMTPADIAWVMREIQQEDAMARSANEEVSRLAKDKPLYSELAEDDMVHAIHKARARLGDTASHEAVFDLAYDMAVHADPDLRMKAAAARKAAAADPRRMADARRAASVNVTSTSTGQSRQFTEDELLGQAYDEAQNSR
nr:MAG TPA: hypothetical protein [Caudoviricetes sp.]